MIPTSERDMQKPHEAERPRPDVAANCRRCGTGPDHAFAVVSPTGIAHIGDDYGMTACGIDATGDKWWWPL